MIGRRVKTLLRLTLAALIASALFMPFADALWTLYSVLPFNPQTGADPVYVSGPVCSAFGWITDKTWRFSLATTEAIVGAFLGITLYALFSRMPRLPDRTLCAHCGNELCGLKEPSCPACGEHL